MKLCKLEEFIIANGEKKNKARTKIYNLRYWENMVIKKKIENKNNANKA